MFDKKSKIIISTMVITAVILVGVLGTAGVMLSMEALIGDALYAKPLVRKQKADYMASLAPTTPVGGTVFLGDSIIEMYDLDKHFPDKGYINRGISGDRSEDILARLDSNVIAIEPSRVVIIVGINDMGHDIPMDTYLDNYAAIIDRINEALPDTEVMLQSLYPLHANATLMGIIGVKSRSNSKVLQWNKSIAELAANKGCEYLDTHSVLTDSNGKLNKAYTREGLHINDSGYAVISAYLSKFI